MGTTKKLIELNDESIKILQEQAKKEKRSLKNYLEFTLEHRAQEFKEPTNEYKLMIDDMMERFEKRTLKTTPVSEVRKKYDL